MLNIYPIERIFNSHGTAINMNSFSYKLFLHPIAFKLNHALSILSSAKITFLVKKLMFYLAPSYDVEFEIIGKYILKSLS